MAPFLFLFVGLLAFVIMAVVAPVVIKALEIAVERVGENGR